MDFDFNEEEQAIADLTQQILDDKVTHELLRGFTKADVHVDRVVWDTLAEAGIVGAALPEPWGGAGLGFLAVTAAIEQIGSHAALAPLMETVVMAGLPIAEFGTDDQRCDLLPRIADGSLLATGAFVRGPGVRVVDNALTGAVAAVPLGLEANLLLVPTDAGVHLIGGGDQAWRPDRRTRIPLR